MPETFLILLAGGIMFAAGISDPKQVTLQWLRLCGILALAMAGLAMFFMSRQPQGVGHRVLYNTQDAASLEGGVPPAALRGRHPSPRFVLCARATAHGVHALTAGKEMFR